MATHEFELTDPPDNPRKRELWLQHALGVIIFEDVRDYAMQKLPTDLPEEALMAAKQAIDNTIYGFMMILDGVTGSLENKYHSVQIRAAVEMTEKDSARVVQTIDVLNGDGMCMGYHSWKENDFGETPPHIPKRPPLDE